MSKQSTIDRFFKVSSLFNQSSSQEKRIESKPIKEQSNKTKRVKKMKGLDLFFTVKPRNGESALLRNERLRKQLIEEKKKIKEEEKARKKAIKEKQKLLQKKIEEEENEAARQELERQEKEFKIRKDGKGVEVCPGVFIGTQLTAMNLNWLQEMEVEGIVNCTKNITCYYNSQLNENFKPEDYQGITNKEYLRIPIDDDGIIPIDSYFDQTYSFVEKIRNKGKSVLFHCKYGKSRSASLLTFYLLKKYQITVNAAKELFKKACWTIEINNHFYVTLKEYELLHLNNGQQKRRTRKVDDITPELSEKIENIVSEVVSSQKIRTASQKLQIVNNKIIEP
ncbi:dual specificity protein phosphatase, putative [Entamoeba histolytica HM-1:IMSS-B]|uniref:protein-tyrosine-phosphatase n=6 Tax=Entamoeba histolytica TaxID=5759 RepID=C4MAI4_ENTH1|nr:dual specificity protein phosphatase, putative [Entamoeba histolytica HM-1:IMSS]EMD48157.1 dual specificity protein phosphatase, putative [Entamoeba histolytica KU27]EMH78065.1 dual specificity protein phosphatase, putative [Entamoeba histolytica HM-1:IMSS-B]EMS12706.1 dual specificity protein phosphatase [Entamoeba histolytica HM-3:IMSS]ENY64227.1 dual specificity protein phosphatase, putative [Entamoeba histolytica HM-1:IMSS-A]GAT98820.1 dual specificity protein phosphatase putative [Enta|eukprot:XP_648921.1 dual specificity protein phosphatase, putative [Entamoeba histolytica HM-1:IMSS]